MKRLRKVIAALFVFIAALLGLHLVIELATTITPPPVETSKLAVAADGPIARAGRGYTVVRAGVRETYVEGAPEEMGAEHVSLVRDRMVAGEEEVWGLFETFVPVSPLRTLVMDISRVRYRHVDRGMPEARRREIAAEARAFDPDPFASRLPTYHRLVFLHAMYDIALSFERSPLLGCTSFAVAPPIAKDGHVIAARAFDFEAAELFDRDKEVLFVRGDGTIPFASVGWPGLIGVVSGVNLEGVMVVVHGGRAREPRAEGIPVVFSLREVLERAHTTEEAISILSAQEVMVSHIVFVADAGGRFAVVERAPGAPAFVRHNFADPARVGVTNHFEGPLAADERNQAVRASTTSVARRERIDELLASATPNSVDARAAVGMLRDHACAGGRACALGDRRSIDALIATHGIVADLTDKTIWVSRGPHLSGAFVRFDLGRIFAPGHDPKTDPAPETIEEDPILYDGRYDEARAHALRRTENK
jgi:hypothetical protein